MERAKGGSVGGSVSGGGGGGGGVDVGDPMLLPGSASDR